MSKELYKSPVTNKYDANPTDPAFYRGFLDTGVNSYDPYVSGYAFILWLKLPVWVEKNHPLFRKHTEKNFKSMSGINDIELETEGAKQGFTNNEAHYTKGIGTKPSEFTLKYQKHSGGPITPAYNAWVSGIRDPRTGIATYPKEHNLTYHSSNHTGTLLYIVTRPDADNHAHNPIEFACIWTHAQPKKISLEPYNFEQGSHEMFDLDQPFTGIFNFGPKIDEFAHKQLKNLYAFTSEADYGEADMRAGRNHVV